MVTYIVGQTKHLFLIIVFGILENISQNDMVLFIVIIPMILYPVY